MSENPYQSVPSLPNPSRGAPVLQQKPAWLTAIPVICLVLGLLGGLFTLAGLVMLVYQSFNGGPPVMPAGMADYQAEMAEFQQQQFVPNLIFNGCGLIVASLLVVGSIGVLKLQERGRNLLRNALLLAVIFVALRGVYTAWIQYRAMEMLSRTMTPPNGTDAVTFETGMQIGVIAVIVLGLIWGALLIVFYLWSRAYLNKQSVVPFFAAAN